MTALVDRYGSFRSRCAYPAVPDALRVDQDFAGTIRFRPLLPLAVRDPAFFSPDNLKSARSIRVGWPRRAEMLGLPHARPQPDPPAAAKHRHSAVSGATR